MALNARIKELRKALKIGQDEMAAAIGVHKQTLSRYERGEIAPGAELLQAIAKKYRVSIDWLITGDGPPPASPPTDEEGHISIPLYSATASAGHGRLDQPDDIIEQCKFRIDWIRTTMHANPHKLALLRISGDSMEPTLRSGDVIMIDREITEPADGKIFVVNLAGQVVAKRVQAKSGGKIDLISDNSIYPVIPLGSQSKIIGRVVWFGRILI